ncbi:MAG TPA: universal stress protein [Candidatus Saccharicenans sp.]|jgi:nucleotide-binding universal stress UspA family protein|nr:universal stress protein [Candidatus Saccharicenans sp.]HQM73845.1 universal stress protein [Candidatus Saccharicenans sp.]
MNYQIKNILWSTDFSAESLAALNYANYLAEHFKASIKAVHVVPDFAPALYETRAMMVADLIKRQEDLIAKARKRLEKISAKNPIKFSQILIETGSAGKKVPEIAEKEHCQLIAVGRKGMSALEKILLGSVANQILRRSKVPVLIAPKKRGQAEIKKILVPTDFSAGEEKERDYAWALASKLQADLTLIYVLELYDFKFSPEEVKALMDESLARLQNRKKRRSNIKVEEVVIRDLNAPAGIVTYANRHKFDLILMSTCVSPVERFFLGSTTEKVISYATMPVLALPAAYCKT